MSRTLTIFALGASLFSPCTLQAKEKTVDFNSEIRPLLSDKCYFCHGPDAADIKGDLQLHTFEKATSDRDGAGAAIVPGSPEKSLLWERITHNDPDEVMPPPKRHMKITPDEAARIKAWIEQGAEYETLWSLRWLQKKVELPPGDFPAAKNPIDRFVQATLREHDLSPAADADKESLLRRVHLTLTGLLPTPEELEAFLSDDSEEAYEQVVDTLLSSQAYAEHMTVEWLDVARYADSWGYQIDRSRKVWPWRDWVLRSFASNKPYDVFITEQLAGDLLPNANGETILATAFNRLHGMKMEGGSIPEEFRVEYVADRAQTAAAAFMGLTMECARCHDHKYDPLTMKDYYSLFAFFNNIAEAGLNSYYTTTQPSPSLPVLKDDERQQLKSKERAVQAAEENASEVARKEKKAFKKWKKNWDGRISVSGQIAAYSFDGPGPSYKNKVNEKEAVSIIGGMEMVTDGLTGNAIRFDGDSLLKLGDIGPLERHRPFSFSVALNTPEQHKRAVILHRSKAWTDAASRGYELLMIDGALEFALVHFSPGNEIRIRTTHKLAVDTWSRVTATYDGSSRADGLALYLDGELADTEIVRDHLTKEIWYKGRKGATLTLAARMRDMGFKQSLIDEFSFWDRALTPLEVREHHAPGAEPANDKDLFSYYLASASEEWTTHAQSLQEARKALNEYRNDRTYMMVMKERHDRRKTFVLKRGLYSDPDKNREVQPAPPAAVFPFEQGTPRNRLGLARWLTHPEHPLTSRVTVNRYWQLVFGEGIVPTTNDFGFQGALPSHPDLLDYLARYLVDSEWNLRALLKHMVMSHTFRQSSVATRQQREQDPGNVLLARGPSNHMSAEMLRDNAIYVSGALDRTFGGAPVQANSTRRSLYVTWKRSEPEPTMLLFGTPRRNVCSVKREKTSTPLQALVLLNSPHYVKNARRLAEKTLQSELKSDEERSADVYRRLTSRRISGPEQEILIELLHEQKEYFESRPDESQAFLKAAGGPAKGVDAAELAAWTSLAGSIMNLDAFYMVR